jgi:hypothetical protein
MIQVQLGLFKIMDGIHPLTLQETMVEQDWQQLLPIQIVFTLI